MSVDDIKRMLQGMVLTKREVSELCDCIRARERSWPEDRPIGKVISDEGDRMLVEIDPEFIGTPEFEKLMEGE